jgi:hypothetical protein
VNLHRRENFKYRNNVQNRFIKSIDHLEHSAWKPLPSFTPIQLRKIIVLFILIFLLLLLSLAPQPSLGLSLLHKIRLNFLEASQFSFLQGRVVSPTPNPHPGEPGLCIYIPQRQDGYPF